MKIPIRIKEYKVNSKNSRFDLFGGIKNIFINIKILFTKRILIGGDAWTVINEDIDILRDVSLIRDDNTGEYKFSSTPEGNHETSLEISQNIKS